MDRLSVELSVRRREFIDFQELVLLHIRKVLACVAGRPPDLDIYNSGGFAQSNVLLQR
jgi:hypothetical protein